MPSEGSGARSGRPSVFRMIREDNNVQTAFMIMVFGLMIVVMIAGFNLSKGPAGGFSTTTYLMIASGVALAVVGAVLLRKRVRSLAHTYSTGQEVKGKVTDCKVGTAGKAGTRTVLEVSYTYLGRPYRSRTTLPYAVPIAAGTEVAIVVDADNPDQFVLRDSYESKRGALEASTDTCSVCQEQIPFLDVNNHMKMIHPREFVIWKLWMVSVIATIVIPIGAMALSVIVFNDERVLVVVVIAIVLIVGSQIAIDRLGEKWEKKVSEAWKASHSDRSGRRMNH
jgi:uncharacterized membrane protein